MSDRFKELAAELIHNSTCPTRSHRVPLELEDPLCRICLTKVVAAALRNAGSAESKADETLTMSTVQARLPWTIHYGRDFRAAALPHKDFQHALIHVFKACGKLALACDEADHGRVETAFIPEMIERYVADLVVCALRMAKTTPGGEFDLWRAVVDRIEVKNGVRLDKPPALAAAVDASVKK